MYDRASKKAKLKKFQKHATEARTMLDLANLIFFCKGHLLLYSPQEQDKKA